MSGLISSQLLNGPKNVPAWDKGFEWDNLVFSMLGVTGLILQFRKPTNFWKGRLQSFQAQAP